MKLFQWILCAAGLLFMCCGRQVSSSATSTAADSSIVRSSDSLPGKLSIAAVLPLTDSVPLTFTVMNPGSSDGRFCQWHTGFEPWISKYLEITSAAGEEVPYIGAMAKRVMPPPASSYRTVRAGNSVSVTVNLAQGYRFTKSGTYRIRYVGEGVSGVKIPEQVSFTLTER
jgi:hypothetical protein